MEEFLHQSTNRLTLLGSYIVRSFIIILCRNMVIWTSLCNDSGSSVFRLAHILGLAGELLVQSRTCMQAFPLLVRWQGIGRDGGGGMPRCWPWMFEMTTFCDPGGYQHPCRCQWLLLVSVGREGGYISLIPTPGLLDICMSLFLGRGGGYFLQ